MADAWFSHLAAHRLAFTAGGPLTAHPLVPTVVLADTFPDADASPSDGYRAILELLAQVASRERVPRANAYGNTHFQLDRGELGVSL